MLEEEISTFLFVEGITFDFGFAERYWINYNFGFIFDFGLKNN